MYFRNTLNQNSPKIYRKKLCWLPDNFPHKSNDVNKHEEFGKCELRYFSTMSTQGNQYQSIFSYLRSLNFHFLDTWVIECVNYYKSANPSISFDVLKNEVKQQWLLVNLREIKVPCLPPDLKSKEKVILNGNYTVQVESMIDSSVSCYSQFQKLLKVNIDDIEATKEAKEVKNHSKRCLTFDICDGVQELRAMEYQPITKIKTNDPELLPGFKMVITGPVECRKGMILLKDENVRIYGGEVDTLTVTNSLKNILIRKLELDEADYSDNTSTDHAEELVQNTDSSNLAQCQQDNIEDTNVDSLLSQNDDLLLSVPLETEVLAQETQAEINRNTTQHVNETDLFDDSEDIWNEEIITEDNQLANGKKHSLSQEDLEKPNQKRRSLDTEFNENRSAVQNLVDVKCEKDMFIDDLDEPQCIFSSATAKPKKPVQTKLSSFFKNGDSSSDKVCRTSDCQKPVFVSNAPFVYFKQIRSIELSKPTIFTFKAIILTLKKKITIENDEFHLKANITDGSASVDVDFCSSVLEDILGFSPCEMTAMIKAKQTNSAISQRIKEAFSKAQQKLISLNCLMEIKFFNDGRSPVILSLEEVTRHHLRALKERRLV